MCGLAGALLPRGAVLEVVDLLENVEYRGYDSHGIAAMDASDIVVRKKLGAIDRDSKYLLVQGLNSMTTCIGHTRWATHGAVTLENCHPILSHNGNTAIVHNGIISNYYEIRCGLERVGIINRSDTDSEVAANLFEHLFAEHGNVLEALRGMLLTLKGELTILLITKHAPGRIFGVSCSSTLLWSVGETGSLLASDENALAKSSRMAFRASDNDIISISRQGCTVHNVASGELRLVSRDSKPLNTYTPPNVDVAIKYMLSEIYEIPQSVQRALAAAERISGIARVSLARSPVILTGAGGSYFQALLGQCYFNRISEKSTAAVPADELLSFCRLSKDTHLVALTQSGETYDTVDAIKLADAMNATTTVITNSAQSQSVVYATNAIFQNSGMERAVPSTKTTVAQAVILHQMAVWIGFHNGVLSEAEVTRRTLEASRLPNELAVIIKCREGQLRGLASRLAAYSSIFVCGKGYFLPVALEVALKIKEVCYLHAEAVPLGMVKHGALAMVDGGLPTLVFGTAKTEHDGGLHPSLSQIKSRGGVLFGIMQCNEPINSAAFDELITVPSINAELDPIVSITLGQLLTYYIGEFLGRPIDRPRNLAKSVTVR